MKRTHETAIEQEEYPFLPHEIWLEVLDHLALDDIISFLTLLSVEKNAIHYVREKMAVFIVKIMNHLHAERNFLFPVSSVNYGSPTPLVAQQAIYWLTNARFGGQIKWKGSQERTSFCERIVHYLAYCLMDRNAQTVFHWSNMLSFFNLCHHYHHNRAGRHIEEALDVKDTVGMVFHFDEDTQRVTRLIDREEVMTIVSSSSFFDDLRVRAITKVFNKYKDSNLVKLELYRQIIDNNEEPYLMYAVVYDLLKEELELRKPRTDDPLSLIVIRKKDRGDRTEHIMIDDKDDISSRCFVYTKSDDLKAATNAMLLYKNEVVHSMQIYERFSIDESTQPDPVKEDAITEKIYKAYVRK